MSLERLFILKPVYGKHEGSCFRELIDLWKEEDLCDVINNIALQSNPMEYSNETLYPESRVWVKEVGDILLYDNPLLDKLPKEWRFGLFANEIYESDKSSNWIFWARWPRQYNLFKKQNNILGYNEREITTLFIGNITTPIRLEQKWDLFIEEFITGQPLNNHKDKMLINYNDYMSYTANSKFGLSLRGVGPKCLRDIEYMGLGTVPIFTPGVSTNYFNPLERDKHYLFAEKDEQIPDLINKCSKDQWEYMSNECLKWYEQNCSVKGSYKITIKILKKYGMI